MASSYTIDLPAPANATAFFSRAQSKRPIPKGGQGRSARHYSDMESQLSQFGTWPLKVRFFTSSALFRIRF